MSTLNGGPGNIVTNGLVLYLDAANYQSYVSGSTTWYDLSGNNNNTTGTSNTTYNAANNVNLSPPFNAANAAYVTANASFGKAKQSTIDPKCMLPKYL